MYCSLQCPTLFPYTTLFRSLSSISKCWRRYATVSRSSEIVRLLLSVLPSESSARPIAATDRKSTRLNSSHANMSYAVFCLQYITLKFSLRAGGASLRTRTCAVAALPRPFPRAFSFDVLFTSMPYTLSLHDALPISVEHLQVLAEVRDREQVERDSAVAAIGLAVGVLGKTDSSNRSEEHTSELQSRQYVVCRLLLAIYNFEVFFACGRRQLAYAHLRGRRFAAPIPARIFFRCIVHFNALHSFPTRRSSDLCRASPSAGGGTRP